MKIERKSAFNAHFFEKKHPPKKNKYDSGVAEVGKNRFSSDIETMPKTGKNRKALQAKTKGNYSPLIIKKISQIKQRLSIGVDLIVTGLVHTFHNVDAIIRNPKILIPTRNIAQWEVLRTRKDYKEACKMLDVYKSYFKNHPHPFISVKDEPLKSAKIDGICWAFCIDLAKRDLQAGNQSDKNFIELVQGFEKGAPAEAAALQSIYHLLRFFSLAAYLEEENSFLSALSQIVKFKKEEMPDILNVDFSKVRSALTGSFSFDASSTRLDILEIMGKVINKGEQAKQPAKWLSEPNDQGIRTVEDLEGFKKAVMKEVNLRFDKIPAGKLDNALRERTEAVKTLEWVIAFLEFREGVYRISKKKPPKKETTPPVTDQEKFWQRLKARALKIFKKNDVSKNPMDAISNPQIRYFLSEVVDTFIARTKENEILRVQGLKTAFTDEIIGHPAMFASDEARLKHFKDLKPGVYQISFQVKGGGHATFYKKTEGGMGYYVDPNYGLFHPFPANASHAEMIKKIVWKYAEHHGGKLYGIKGKPNHLIEVVKIENS